MFFVLSMTGGWCSSTLLIFGQRLAAGRALTLHAPVAGGIAAPAAVAGNPATSRGGTTIEAAGQSAVSQQVQLASVR